MRLLPYVILCLIIAVLTRAFDAADDVVRVLTAPPAKAQAVEEPTSKPTPAKVADKVEDEKKIAEENKGSAEKEQKLNSNQATKTDIKNNKQEEETTPAEQLKTNSQEKPCKSNITHFSDPEIQVLQHLKKRRDELNQKEDEIILDRNVMRVIEQSIDTKLVNLQKLQDELHSIMGKYEEKQNANIAGLVKIYESMKPRDAAKIFDTLQMSVLLDVARQMKELRLAPILALMDPEKAKDLTVALANQRKLTDIVRNPILPFDEAVVKHAKPESIAALPTANPTPDSSKP